MLRIYVTVISVIFVTMQAFDGAHKFVSAQVDFSNSTWSIQNPKGLTLRGTSGKIFSGALNGSSLTTLFLDDGKTPVASLQLFGPNTQAQDSGSGSLLADDPNDAFEFKWTVTSVVQ